MMRLVLALGLVAAAVAPALSQVKAGDTATVSVESSIDLEIQVRDGSGEVTRLLSLVRRETFEQEVLAVAETQATSVRIRVVSSTLQKSGTDAPLEEKATALSGQTYTSVRGQSGWIARDPDGGAAPAEGSGLGTWNDAGRLLPKAGLAAGGQWDIDAAQISALVSPSGLKEAAGKLTCTCQALEGNKASIVFSGQITGKGKDDAQVTLILKTGRLEYDLSKGRPTMLSVSGSYESLLTVEDVYRKPNEENEERRKIGEVLVKSRKLEAIFTFK
jgi:hypothetical protein